MSKFQPVFQPKRQFYKQRTSAGQSQDRLAEVVKSSTEKNRQYFVVYISLLTYVLLMVLSTTDQMLLVPTQGIKLPLIDVSLPLISFYVVAPLFLLAIHFNLLQNLESHHFKLMRWREACGTKGVPRTEINAFLFDFQWLESGSQMETLVRLSSRALFLHSGPFALGILLWRFTDYQDLLITFFHLLLFAADTYLVWQTELSFQKNELPVQSQSKEADSTAGFWAKLLKSIVGFFVQLFHFSLHLLKTSQRRFFGLLVLMQFVFACWIHSNSDGFVDDWKRVDGSLTGLKREALWLYSLLVPIIYIQANETIWLPTKMDVEMQAMMDGSADTTQWWVSKGKGLNLENRQLRGLSAYSANLPKLKLNEHSDLRVANLEFSHLQGADFSFAKLQGSNLMHADLRYASMVQADLDEARLIGARLQGASLMATQFKDADLSDAEFQETKFAGAVFINTQMGCKQMQSLVLTDEQLKGIACKQEQQ